MSEHPGFGDAEAQRIIKRAAEIDAQRAGSLDAQSLREIAAAAGISPAAVDQAIAERLQPRPPKRSWLLRHPGLVITLGILATLFFMRLFVVSGPH